MRVTILPPLFYPGRVYFDLLRHVDVALLATDWLYVRGKYNRSRIQDGWLTAHITRPNKKVRCPFHQVKVKPFQEWHPQLVSRLEKLYGKNVIAYHPMFKMFKALPDIGENYCNIVRASIKEIMLYMGIRNTLLCDVKDLAPKKNNLRGQRRIINLCRRIRADEFVSFSEKTRYDPVAFRRMGIKLSEFVPQTNNKENTSILHECFKYWE